MSVTVDDVANSEIVLLRQDDEDDPRSEYEIARGDELACWRQLEMSLRNDSSNTVPVVKVTVPDEGTGAWSVNGIRYIWMLETLKPQLNVPGRIFRQISISDCEQLLRRYRLAKRIHGKEFKHSAKPKRVDYLSSMPESYRVDLYFVLRQIKKAGLTWETYIAKYSTESLEMVDTLPVGFVLELLQNLNIDQPNQVFAKPNLSEMSLVEDDGLLRALMSQVDHVRYVSPINLANSVEIELREAVEEFATSLYTYKMLSAGGMQGGTELPHLVWAADAEELRLSIEALGLRMYAAITPHLHPIKEMLPEIPGITPWPWAFGYAVFFRFEQNGSSK